MKIKSFYLALGRTINLGNFESARVDYGVEVEVIEGDDLAERTAEAEAHVRQTLDRLSSEG